MEGGSHRPRHLLVDSLAHEVMVEDQEVAVIAEQLSPLALGDGGDELAGRLVQQFGHRREMELPPQDGADLKHATRRIRQGTDVEGNRRGEVQRWFGAVDLGLTISNLEAARDDELLDELTHVKGIPGGPA